MKTKFNNLMGKRWIKLTVLACGLVSIATLQGCAVGPKLYESSFTDYNDAIRKTSDGQMLANLVRMRYLESPIFLQVASVSTSFNMSANAGASATINESAADAYGVSAGAGFSETPTITFSLPESRGYYGLLMAPLSTNQITQLIDAGFDSRDVMQTAVRRINGLENLSIDHSLYPKPPRTYSGFLEALDLIEKLSTEELAEFAPSSAFSIWSSPVGPIKFDAMSQIGLLASQVYAQSASGADLIENAKGQWEMHTFTRRMALRFPPEAIYSPDAKRLKQLLQLDSQRNSFPMLDFEFTSIEKGRAYVGASPAALDSKSSWLEIGIRGRSMMEIMQIASTGVNIPEEDVSGGIVYSGEKKSPAPGELVFDIKSSNDEPLNAALRVKYRDHWFYIPDNDLESRKSFALLNAFFAVTAGTVPGANPVLTLPVK
ncbi:hypothetical protein L4D76_06360 [Photobacterium sagamiensis]|uniref:hypothetical protein n=1 Tax=Photobacterium sagamiensis TaxID=2910241 RepID=UPI003D09F3C8